ncbi:host specificity protein, partial [Escherichia coli]
TELLETQTVDFSVGAEGLRHVPGDVIEICDDDYAGISIGGRVLAVNSQTRTLTLDREITLPSSGTTLINHTHSVTGASAVSQWSQNGSVHKVVSAASVNTSAAGAHTHSVSGTAASAGAHAHTVGIGAHTHSVAIGSHGHTITVNAAGNAENTVKNIAFNYIVRLA